MRAVFLSRDAYAAYRATGMMPREGAFMVSTTASGMQMPPGPLLGRLDSYRAAYRKVLGSGLSQPRLRVEETHFIDGTCFCVTSWCDFVV